MKKRVLISNDDSINAEGLKAIAKAVGRFAKVYVVAPSEQMSAKAQALTFRHEIKAEMKDVKGATEAWAFGGTPVDCVKWGIQHYREKGIEMDYVIGGINHGPNNGLAVHYSGTVAIAREAALQGIKGIALSVGSHEASQWDYICSIIEDVFKLADEVGPETFLSVNAPDIPSWKVKGIRFVPLAPYGKGENYRFETVGEDSYRMTIDHTEYDPDAMNDFSCGQKNYATITALTCNIQDRRAMRQLQRLSLNKALCLFIDFQNKLVPAMNKSEELMKNVCKLARCMNRLEQPVMLTRQYAKGLGETEGELKKALKGSNYEEIDKISFSCWDNAEFADKMNSLAIRTVIIAGIESHICVQQTARDFLEEGFKVYIVEDCCASRDKHNHKLAMERLSAAGCIVTGWESVVYEIMGSSTHNAFKTISSIVKED